MVLTNCQDIYHASPDGSPRMRSTTFTENYWMNISGFLVVCKEGHSKNSLAYAHSHANGEGAVVLLPASVPVDAPEIRISSVLERVRFNPAASLLAPRRSDELQ